MSKPVSLAVDYPCDLSEHGIVAKRLSNVQLLIKCQSPILQSLGFLNVVMKERVQHDFDMKRARSTRPTSSSDVND